MTKYMSKVMDNYSDWEFKTSDKDWKELIVELIQKSKTSWLEFIVFANGTFYSIANGRILEDDKAKEFEKIQG